VIVILVVLALVVLLAIALIVAVARDPGPDPADVAIGYAVALGAGDFDAVYRMIDPDLLSGRNRPNWVEEQRRRPHPAIARDAVIVRSREVHTDDALVTLSVGAERDVPVDLVRRQGIWTVARFDGTAPATARRR
jgi:hypothetical protein